MSAPGRGLRAKLTRDWEPQSIRRRENEKAEAERGERESKRLRKQVESELRAELAALEADAMLTPEQRERNAERAELRSLTAPLSEQLARPTAHPIGWALMREDILRERQREAEEQRERDCGLPARRDKWDAAAQAINEARDAAIQKAAERCRADEQAARDRAATQRAELGERPTLEAPEAVAA